MTEIKGCGGKATRMACRGRVKRTFFCNDCEYAGSGRVLPYATDVAGEEKKPGVFTGPARTCGQTIGEEPEEGSYRVVDAEGRIVFDPEPTIFMREYDPEDLPF